MSDQSAPFWCVGILDLQSRKPCGRIVEDVPDDLPFRGWQPLCRHCGSLLYSHWEKRRRVEAWDDRVGRSKVYIAARDGYLKVGKSEYPDDRLKALARENDATKRPPDLTPGPLDLLATFPGTYDEERSLQRRLGEFVSIGEWFKDVPEAREAAADWIIEYGNGSMPSHRHAEVRCGRLVAKAAA